MKLSYYPVLEPIFTWLQVSEPTVLIYWFELGYVTDSHGLACLLEWYF